MNQQPASPDSASRYTSARWFIAILIFCSTLIRYYEPRHPTRHLCGIGYESLELGCSLAHKGTFSDPFRFLETGPSAHVAPAFPAAIAGIIKIFGDQADGAYAVQWAGAVLLALQLSFWPFLSKRLGMGFSAGVLGAIAFLFAGIVLLPMWEAFYVGLMIALVSYLHPSHFYGTAIVELDVLYRGLLWGTTLSTEPGADLRYACDLDLGVVFEKENFKGEDTGPGCHSLACNQPLADSELQSFRSFRIHSRQPGLRTCRFE